jgi:hypothetical protein
MFHLTVPLSVYELGNDCRSVLQVMFDVQKTLRLCDWKYGVFGHMSKEVSTVEK